MFRVKVVEGWFDIKDLRNLDESKVKVDLYEFNGGKKWAKRWEKIGRYNLKDVKLKML